MLTVKVFIIFGSLAQTHSPLHKQRALMTLFDVVKLNVTAPLTVKSQNLVARKAFSWNQFDMTS